MAFSQLSIRKLNASNFVDWSVDVKFVLLEKNCWNIVNGTETLPIENENTTATDVKNYKIRENLALSIIYFNIEPEYRWLIEDCKIAAEVWDKLKRHFQPNSKVRHMQLFYELLDSKIKPGEKLVTFASRLMKIWEQLNEFEQPLSESYLSFQLLKYLPLKFDCIVGQIMQWPDDKFIFKDIVLALVAEESRLEVTEKDRKEECNIEVRNSQRKNVRCFLCKKKGHVKNECRFVYRNIRVKRDSKLTEISFHRCCKKNTGYRKLVTTSLSEFSSS